MMSHWLHAGIVLFLALISPCYPRNILLPEYDLCNPENSGFKTPIITMPTSALSTEVFVNLTYEEAGVCRLFFQTCPMCRLQLKLVDINFGNESCNSGVIKPAECLPSCHHLSVIDLDYDQKYTIIASDHSETVFTSESSQIFILGCFKKMNAGTTVSMRMIITAEAKIQTIRGSSNSILGSKTIYSPNYPHQYAVNDDIYMYRIQSTLKTDIITVVFDDWFVSPSSTLQVQEGNLTSLRYIYSDHPYIISKGPEINITFYPGYQIPDSDQSDHVFKAVVTFYKDQSEALIYLTDCGGYASVDGVVLSKTITDKLRDCIWVIEKDDRFDGVILNFPKYRTENYFSGIMEVRSGLTSDQRLLRPTIGFSSWDGEPSGPISVFFSEVGFYIRIRGQFYMEDSMLFSYAMYLNDCFETGNYFKCDNGKCIQLVLKCDGYDHCGDKSDESSYLCRSNSNGSSGSSNSSSISIGIIVPMVVSVFLVIVICLLIIFIRRCRRLNNSAFGNQPNVLAQQQNRGHRRRRHNVQMSVTVSSGDHPPSYDEVIQNTPIGYLNMAFSWTPGDHSLDPHLAQPPSYEESILPASTTTTSQSTPATANSTTLLSRSNNLLHSTTNLSAPLQNGAGATRATLFASLDPGAYVSSSSSSSEGASDQDNRLNTSSSSDSSTDLENGLFPTGAQRVGSNVISKNDMKVNLDPKSRNSVHEFESDETCIQLSPVVLTKENNETNRKLSKSMNHLNQIARDVNDQDCRNYSNVTSTKNEENASATNNKDSQHVSREGMYVKKPQQKMSKHIPAQDLDKLQGITENSRSHSCIDLSLRGAVGGYLPDEDKRFSYAGYGDVSLKKGNFDPYLMGRGLVRDKPIENLNKYSAVSYDNLSDRYSTRKNADNYEQDKKQTLLSGKDSYHQKNSIKSSASTSSLNRFSDTDSSLGSASDNFSGCRPKTKSQNVATYHDDHPIVNTAKYGQNQYSGSRSRLQYPDHHSYVQSSNEHQRQSGTSHDKYTAVEHRKRIHSTDQNLDIPDQPRTDPGYRKPDPLSDSHRSQQKDRQSVKQHNQKEKMSTINRGITHSEPIYQTPRPISDVSKQPSPEKDNQGVVQLIHKPHQQEHIYQTPRPCLDQPPNGIQSEAIYQNPHANTEIRSLTSDRNINSDRIQSAPRKPIPTPRQGVVKMHKPTDRPVPVARSNSRKQVSSNNPSAPPSFTSASSHPYPAQSSGYATDLMQASVRLTGSQACESHNGENHDTSRDETVLTLDPSVFNPNDKDVFV